MGNGGTCGIIENWACDLSLHPFVSDDKQTAAKTARRLRVQTLPNSLSKLTGLTNDLGFSNAYSEELKSWAQEGDLLVGVSGSGNSANIVQALERGRTLGLQTVLITRNPNSQGAKFANIVICTAMDSKFPGQNTSGNMANFYMEDFVCQLSHITAGLLKEHVQTNDGQPA